MKKIVHRNTEPINIQYDIFPISDYTRTPCRESRRSACPEPSVGHGALRRSPVALPRLHAPQGTIPWGSRAGRIPCAIMKPVSCFSRRGALVNRVDRPVRSSRLNSSPVRSIGLPVRHPGMCRSHDSDTEFRPVLGGCDAGLMIPRFLATCGYSRKLESVSCNPRHRGDPPRGRERQRACARRGAARHNSLAVAPSPPLPGKLRTARWPSACVRPASRARRPAPGGSGTATASRRVRPASRFRPSPRCSDPPRSRRPRSSPRQSSRGGRAREPRVDLGFGPGRGETAWPHPEARRSFGAGRPIRTCSRRPCIRSDKIVDGTLYTHRRPESPYTRASSVLGGRIGLPFYIRRWGPGRVVDPRRTGAAPRRRGPRAESCGVAPGTDRGFAPYVVLSPCAGLGVRGAVALDARFDLRAERPACARRRRAPVARRSDGPHLGGVRAPGRRVGARRVREGRRAGEHPAVRCDHAAQLVLDWKIGPRLVCFVAAEDFAQCSRTCL